MTFIGFPSGDGFEYVNAQDLCFHITPAGIVNAYVPGDESAVWQDIDWDQLEVVADLQLRDVLEKTAAWLARKAK